MDATTALREKLTEIKGLAPPAQYGLFLADEDPKKGVWLDPARTLEHYLLRENVSNIVPYRMASKPIIILWIRAGSAPY